MSGFHRDMLSAVMLDLPDHPVLPKDSWIGACRRLRVSIDAPRLKEQVARLPERLWGDAGGRVGVHRAAEAIWLRGHAPAEGDEPIEDREPLAALPYVRELIGATLGGVAQRCLLARLPAGGVIAPHIDRAPYFAKTLRLHIPVQTHENVHMVCRKLCYHMREGEVWALNNSAPHAVWNAHLELARTHLICDFLPLESLLERLREAESELGVRDEQVLARIAAAA